MIHEEVQFRRLMAQLLDGDLSAEESNDLARLCADDPEMAARLRAELAMAEMIRHIVSGDSGEAEFSAQVAHRLDGAAAADGGALIARLLDGELADSELDELVRLCWRDQDFASEVRRALAQDDLLSQSAAETRSGDAFLQALETRMWAEQGDDRFVDDIARRLVRTPVAGTIAIPLNPAPQKPQPQALADRVRSRKIVPYTGAWAAAAAAVIALYAAILFEPKPGAPQESVAEVTRAIEGARWNADLCPVEDRYFARGRYRLEAGIVSMRFGSGAEMSVEGPAEFEVRGEREVFVHTGIAMVTKNTALGGGLPFALNTNSLHLGESGESIALAASDASGAEAVVFDGDAQICLPKIGLCRDLFALEAVKSDLGREKLFDVPYNPSRFAKVWKANAGIEGNTGALLVAMPGQETQAAKSDGKVRLSLENIRFVADHDVEVDTLSPGQFAAVSAGEGEKIDSSGRELRSYLLKWQPKSATAVGAGDANAAVEASVTFDHEIVGVIFSPERLAGSDDIVGAATRAATTVASAGPDTGDGNNHILISDDRRTVNLKLRGNNGADADRLDHVRVLVALR